MNLVFSKKYTSEEICVSDLWERRNKDGFSCSKCGSQEGYKSKTCKIWVCKKCNYQTSILINTVFENSKLSIEKWYWATFLMISSKAGISAKELQFQLGVTYKTAWYVTRRLREVMQLANDKYKLCGTITMDEAYFTGRENDDTVPKNVAEVLIKAKLLLLFL